MKTAKHKYFPPFLRKNAVFLNALDSGTDQNEEIPLPQAENTSQESPEEMQSSAVEQARQGDLDQQKEAIQKGQEGAQIQQIRSQLNPAAKEEAQKAPEQQTPSEIYQKLLKPKMDSVINAWGFRSKIEECRSKLSQTTAENKAKIERSVVKELLKKFKGIKENKFAFFPEAMAQEKSANCSGCALVLGHILNEELKIKTEQANPWNHAVNIVTYSDGQTQYVDPRNNKIHDLELKECIEEKDGFRVYKIDKGGLRYGLLPVANAEHAAGLTLMTNTVALEHDARNKDKKALETMNKYGNNLNPTFAKKYTDIHYTSNPDTDPKWLEERRKTAIRKYTTRIPLLGRFL